ncbi:hypothetical protein QTQ03_20635 [Micromonospora sp. WMMA1363]|uniref:hypothetical protein n=1 Tax=Micromonospora sp. WMMA1363 TaxID=3053985 RepID=UPI00259C924B|nr:hypothetical protein [Micromonospora sp. WMMA1363]MDM4721886.1 hypothetical protein [Micromonospora sp. WMMA1363]
MQPHYDDDEFGQAVAGPEIVDVKRRQIPPGYRNQYSILSGNNPNYGNNNAGLDSNDNPARIDADVIMTAAIVGFTQARLAAGYPVQFDADATYVPDNDKENQKTAKNIQNLKAAVKKINNVLKVFGNPSSAVTGVTPRWSEGAMITGAAGAAMMPFVQRQLQLKDDELNEFKKSMLGAGYQGRGAYSGFVADVMGRHGMYTTSYRVNVRSTDDDQRWFPTGYANLESGAPWGVIGGSQGVDPTIEAKLTKADRVSSQHVQSQMEASDLEAKLLPYDKIDLGQFPVVGYVHGMTQAIYKAYLTGPWVTPFEIAVGTQTTKLASCFPCTLFMYATGYPPSSIHLDKGESWVPIPAGSDDGAVDELNAKWYREMDQILRLGAEILNGTTGYQRIANLARPGVVDSHENSLTALVNILRNPRPKTAANLILDAVTLSDKEHARVNRTLKEAPQSWLEYLGMDTPSTFAVKAGTASVAGLIVARKLGYLGSGKND